MQIPAPPLKLWRHAVDFAPLRFTALGMTTRFCHPRTSLFLTSHLSSHISHPPYCHTGESRYPESKYPCVTTAENTGSRVVARDDNMGRLSFQYKWE